MTSPCENIPCDVETPPGAWTQGEAWPLTTARCPDKSTDSFPLPSVTAGRLCVPGVSGEGRVLGTSSLAAGPTPEGGPWSSRRSRNPRTPSAPRLPVCLRNTNPRSPVLPRPPLAPGIQQHPPFTPLLLRGDWLTSICPDLPGNIPLPGSASASSPTCGAPRALRRPRARLAGQEPFPGSTPSTTGADSSGCPCVPQTHHAVTCSRN